MHHIFVRSSKNCVWRGDVCDDTGTCNIFSEYKIPHSFYPHILCGASAHAFQIRLSGKSLSVFHDKFMSEFPEDAFTEWLRSENLHEYLEIWRERHAT